MVTLRNSLRRLDSAQEVFYRIYHMTMQSITFWKDSMRDKVITALDVAEEAKVSSATVSRVLNDSPLVTPKTTARVKKVMEQLGYRPNILARGLRVGATKTIGVIITNVLNPFFSKIVRGIEDAVTPAGYNVIICNTDENENKESAFIRNLVDRKVDGLIIAASGRVNNYSEILGGTPVVFVDRLPNKEEENSFDSVVVNNELGAYQLTKYLIDKGSRRIGLIASDVLTTGSDRISGYKRAVEEAMIPSADAPVEITDYLGNNTVEIARKLVALRVDAIFAGNNIILLSVLQALKETNHLNDLTIAAFDQTDWLSYLDTPVVVVRQPVQDIVEQASNMLLQRIEKKGGMPHKLILQTQLGEVF